MSLVILLTIRSRIHSILVIYMAVHRDSFFCTKYLLLFFIFGQIVAIG